MLKTNILISGLLLVGLACTTKSVSDENSADLALHLLETKEINQAFRDSVGVNSFIKLKDGFTYYELDGPDSGNVIVLVHGFSVPSYIWDSTYFTAINKGYRVLRYDVFGRGFSDRSASIYDITLSYRQLSGLIDSLQISTPISLVGLSWGARVVSYYTAKHPNKVNKLVLVDPSGFEPDTKKGNVSVKVSDSEVVKALSERAPLMASSQLEDFYHPERFDYWPSLYKPQMEYKGFVYALLSTQANKRNLSKFMIRVGENGTPVKLIMGKEDKVIIPKETIRYAKEQMPTIDITLIDNAGHLPHIEETYEFNKVFFEFLEN